MLKIAVLISGGGSNLKALLDAAAEPGFPGRIVAVGSDTEATGLAYAPGERHGIDVYAPEGAQDAPVVVFLYGGAWESGDRGMYRFLGASLASAGVVCTLGYGHWHVLGACRPAVELPCAALVR